MVKITEEQKQALSRYIDNLDEHVANDEINDFLDLIDDLVIDNMLSYHDNEPDAEGIKLQRIWDQVYNQN